MNPYILYASSALLGAITLTGVFSHIRRGRQDDIAEQLFEKLQEKLSPEFNGILAQKAFQPDYLNEVLRTTGKNIVILKQSAAEDLASQIHNAWGFWNDDEEAVNSAFLAMKDHVQVSQVAAAYQYKYRISLLEKLRHRLDSTELGEVLDIVLTLPPYSEKT